MNYQDPELRQALAAEYVLGTLHGRARKRFERLAEQDARLRQIIASWEQKLGSLSEGVKPVDVPDRVWNSIQKRLGFSQTQPTKQGVIATIWDSLMLWRSLTTVATIALMFAAYLNLFAPKLIVNQYIAVLQTEQQQASWLIKSDLQNKRMIVHIVNEQTIPIGKAFELWMIKEGDKPISLGLISPDKPLNLPLSDEMLEKIKQANVMAVSIEPAGGSPTGQPTGPVPYTGKVTQI